MYGKEEVPYVEYVLQYTQNANVYSDDLNIQKQGH